jgi:hypothetical protein
MFTALTLAEAIKFAALMFAVAVIDAAARDPVEVIPADVTLV